MKRFASLLLVSASSMVWASASSAATAADEASVGLEEVIVTAQRRAENVQDVPIAVTALTGSQVANAGVVDFTSLGKIVPSLQTTRQAFAGIGFLRGVGSTAANVGMEPPISMYLDDVYVPSGTGSLFELNSVSSLEVLKGPQGTLFGRNATGGVIHVHTRDPSAEPTMDISAGYDNFDTVSGQFYGSTKIAEGVAANLSAYYVDQNDGWGRNLANGDDVFTRKTYGARAKISYDPTADTSFLLSGLYDHRRSNQGLALRVAPGVFSRGGYSPDALGAGFWDVTSNDDDPIRARYKQVSLKASHDFGAAKLVSITAFQQVRLTAAIDADTTPTNLVRVDAYTGGETFTQELQLLSPPDAPISWILGGFYMHDSSFYQVLTTGLGSPIPVLARNTEGLESYSGFAQTTVDIMSDTRMTIGIRYTADTRALHGRATQGAATFGPFDAHKKFQSVTGRFSLDHHFSDDVMGYVAYNRGFKSGLYNIAAINAGTTVTPDPVNPEELDAYSVGVKSEFMDRRLRFNAEAYYYDYRNLQTQNVTSNGSTLLLNGGKATIKGFDADVTFLATPRLTFTASLGLVDGKYDSFKNGLQFFPLPPNAPIPIPAGCAATVPVYPPAAGAAPLAQRTCDLSGNKTIQTPPVTTFLSGTYKLPTTIGDYEFNLSWTHGGDFFFESGNQPYAKQKQTDVFNGSIQWTTVNGAFGVRLWGRNLTNEKFFAYAANSTTSGFKYTPAEPRTYGVTLSAHY
jgi:iron complex outermembrane receptor protein